MAEFSSARPVIGFVFGQNIVKIACVRNAAGKAEVLGVRTCSIEGLSDDEAARVLKDAVHGFKVKNPVFVSSVDSLFVITKNIEIPSVKDAEIKEIIDLQAGRYTPYGRSEIIVDHINVGVYHNSYTKVLIVIVVQEVIKKQYAILTKAGITVNRIQFASESVGVACARAFSLKERQLPCAIVSIDKANTDFIVISKGATVFVRNIPIGCEHFATEPQEFLARFSEEIKKSLDAYRTEDIEALPDELMMMGPVDIIDMMRASLTHDAGMPVRVASLASGFSFSKELIADSGQSSLVSAISAALSAGSTVVDLRPTELKLKMAFQERSREIIKSGIFLMAIIIIFCGMLIVKIYFRSSYLAKLDERLEVIEPQVKALEKASNRVTIIRRFIENKGQSLDILKEIYDLIPDNVYLKSIAIDEKHEITLKGTASAMSEVFTFVSALENSKLFKSAAAQNTASRKEAGKDVSDFEITCKMEEKS